MSLRLRVALFRSSRTAAPLVQRLRRQSVASGSQELLYFLCRELVAVFASDDITNSARTIDDRLHRWIV